MRMRLMALASVSLIAAGCGAASVQAGGGSAASSAASTIAPGALAGPAKGACAGPATPWGTSYETGELTGIEFVSPSQGWTVGQHTILATTDGGAHWQVQLSGNLD